MHLTDRLEIMNVEKFSFKYRELDIKKESLIKLMGYSKESLPQMIDEEIDEVMEKGEEVCNIEGGYRITNNISWDKNNFNILLENVVLNIRRVIFQQIKKSDNVAIFVCTAGKGITDRSREFMKEGDLLKGYVYDLFGSIVVESAMDIIQDSLQKGMAILGLKISNRYSPGYCGWDVAEQRKLFSLLPEQFCGIELTDSCLMQPTKSVSGIIGIGENVKYNNYTCNICDSSNCLYKNLKYR
ncbi:MAG: vitamin B12 dependent-methionine synthase activation domain-containing protein [Ignavibacteriaceae bacterium]|nr:vitamin B12 dependent-methionine synthase activation domain-containing protein [Ignavibacteriaceae bacterium]